MIYKALIFTVLAIGIIFGVQAEFHTQQFLGDVGGISAFLVAFGALYGIMSALIVVEVWVKFNNTKQLIEKEAQEIERLYRLTIYFKDKKLTEKIKTLISEYINIIKKESFDQMGEGIKHTEEEKIFRKISLVIRDVKFNDEHDKVLFASLVNNYGDLSQIRVERIHQCTVRLPVPLRIFFYSSTIFTIIAFIFMPFANVYYSLLVGGLLVCSLSMLVDIVEGLDNPVRGYWKITPHPFEDAWNHIQESYE